MTQKIESIKDFIVECVMRPDEEYEIFEYECSAGLRLEIYALAPDTSPEPFRSAMSFLGFKNY
jgi:hypothetical protein